jgi:hypothetical protein
MLVPEGDAVAGVGDLRVPVAAVNDEEVELAFEVEVRGFGAPGEAALSDFLSKDNGANPGAAGALGQSMLKARKNDGLWM